MDLAGRAHSIPEMQPKDGAEAVRIAGRSFEPNPQSWCAGAIVEEAGRSTVLPDDEVGAAIPIEVADCRAALVACHADPGLGG